MSEQEKQKSSFMQELDQWSQAEIIDPLLYAGARSAEEGDSDWEEIAERVKRAIRTKVLESYRNGQAAGPRKPQQQPRRQFVREYQR